jgi:hypothetical protein
VPVTKRQASGLYQLACARGGRHRQLPRQPSGDVTRHAAGGLPRARRALACQARLDLDRYAFDHGKSSCAAGEACAEAELPRCAEALATTVGRAGTRCSRVKALPVRCV